MIDELVAWFEQEFSVRHILEDVGAIDHGIDTRNRTTRCSKIVMATFEKAMEILTAYDVDFQQAKVTTKDFVVHS